MGRSPITRDVAEKIAKKLDAEIDPSNSAHHIAYIHFNGRVVASFGLRRSSKRDKGHGHVPKDLMVNQSFALELGRCTKYRDDWIDLMKEKGEIDPDEEESKAT